MTHVADGDRNRLLTELVVLSAYETGLDDPARRRPDGGRFLVEDLKAQG